MVITSQKREVPCKFKGKMFSISLQIFFIYKRCLRNLGIGQLDGGIGKGFPLPRKKSDIEFAPSSPEPENIELATITHVYVTQTHL